MAEKVFGGRGIKFCVQLTGTGSWWEGTENLDGGCMLNRPLSGAVTSCGRFVSDMIVPRNHVEGAKSGGLKLRRERG